MPSAGSSASICSQQHLANRGAILRRGEAPAAELLGAGVEADDLASPASVISAEPPKPAAAGPDTVSRSGPADPPLRRRLATEVQLSDSVMMILRMVEAETRLPVAEIVARGICHFAEDVVGLPALARDGTVDFVAVPDMARGEHKRFRSGGP